MFELMNDDKNRKYQEKMSSFYPDHVKSTLLIYFPGQFPWNYLAWKLQNSISIRFYSNHRAIERINKESEQLISHFVVKGKDK